MFGIPDPALPITYTTYIGLRRRLRVVYSRASPMLKPFRAKENSTSRRKGPKNDGFGSLSQEHPLQKIAESLCAEGAKSRMRRTETSIPIWIKFCVMVDIPVLVTYTNFGDHQLRRYWVACGQIFPFSIDFHRRPYNTLALPCECVIFGKISKLRPWN